MSEPKRETLFSVIICTWNRADLLRTVLESLTSQSLDRGLYEVIVVDNNSTDGTRAVAAEFETRAGNVRYCYEERQGLSHARNRGWQEACGRYVAYADDDCRVQPDWLETARKVVESNRPAAFGGPYRAYYTTAPPRWFKDAYESSPDMGSQGRCLEEGEYLFGTNFFVLRSGILAIEGFDTNLGMRGRTTAYGEETDVIIRMRAVQPEALIYYEPGLGVEHLVRPEKFELRRAIFRRFAKGRYVYRVMRSDAAERARRDASTRVVHMARALLKMAQRLLGVVRDLTVAIWLRDRGRYPYPQNFIYEKVLRHVEVLGQQWERVQILIGASSRLKTPVAREP